MRDDPNNGCEGDYHLPLHDFVFAFTPAPLHFSNGLSASITFRSYVIVTMITGEKWQIAPLNAELSGGDLNKETNWVIE